MTKDNEDMETNFASKLKAQCTQMRQLIQVKGTGNHARTLKDPKAEIAGSALHLPNEVRHTEISTGEQQIQDLYFRIEVGRKDPRNHGILLPCQGLQQISKRRIKDMEQKRT